MQLPKPLSHGTTRLKPANADDALTVDPKIVGHQIDHKDLVSLERLLTETLVGEFRKGNGIHEYGVAHSIESKTDRASMDARIVRPTNTYNHPSSSCAMGSVVTSRCKVYGISRLRVVDASVFPFPFAARCQAIVYAIAEKVRLCSKHRYYVGKVNSAKLCYRLQL